MHDYHLSSDYRVVFESPDDGFSYFFGYYDKSPLNQAKDKLLAHRLGFDGRNVKDGDVADLGYFDLKSDNYIKLAETLAWNWQQGSQLQWLPQSKDKIIYNSISDQHFVSYILDLISGTKKKIILPIYSLNPNGEEALGINYERHYWCRPGYNYQNLKNEKYNVPFSEEDGIYRINLLSGNAVQLINTKQMVQINPIPELQGIGVNTRPIRQITLADDASSATRLLQLPALAGKSIEIKYKMERSGNLRTGTFCISASTSGVAFHDDFIESDGDVGVTLSAVLSNLDSTAGNETVEVQYTSTNDSSAVTMDYVVTEMV